MPDRTGRRGGHGGWLLRFHREVARRLEAGERLAVATVVRGRGSHPRGTGAKMLVTEAGDSAFTIGGGPLEATVIADCREALGSGRLAIHSYGLTESGRDALGMTCGGAVEVLIEPLEPPDRLVVFGAGHVGRALARAASLMGLSLTVVDDRPEWLDPAALPEGARLHRCSGDYAGDLPAVGSRELAAVMTRCHASDVNVLESLSRRPPRYVGLIGSRRKVARAKEALTERGVPPPFLEAIRGPIGLDIGAETPGEIAVAVAAELVSVLRRPSGGGEGAP